MVPHLLPSRLGGRLARLPRHAQGPARQDQHGPARHPLPGLVPPPPLHDAHRRHPAVWRRLHRALLHHVLHLAAALLLRVRLPRARAAHPHHHLRRDLDRDVLLPALRGGLPLVVARIPHLGLVGGVHVCVLGLLLLHQARDHKAHLVLALLRLHVHRRPRVLRPHGHHWLLRVLLVRVEDLLGHQGGLGRRGEGEERERESE
mmetsp:Transcript_14411/g.42394  ORF Transcript_14411/g.42394 Transcript_14411/m.42394 type:complete len:203 (+) Transcript_14411:1384-1992(+)